MKIYLKIVVLFSLLPFRVESVPYSNHNDYLSDGNLNGYRQAQFANIDSDIVYVRCPRDREPGSDLVLHRSIFPPNPGAEQVLVDCDKDDTTNNANEIMTDSSITILFIPVMNFDDGTVENLVTVTDNWLTDDVCHTVEVRCASDDIEVSLDGNIVLEYANVTLPSGQISLGSFNDLSYFDNVRIAAGINTIPDLIFLTVSSDQHDYI